MQPRFVGREAELAELTARLEAALAGDPATVLVGGEPGIGKTRLTAELGRLAGARAVPVLWGGCSEDEGAPAYWPWRRVLRAWRALDGAVPAALAPLDAATPPAATGPAERFALFDAAAGFLVDAARPAGLVVVLDDLHWADPASVALLAHVAHEPDARLVLVGTYRPAELRSSLTAVPGTRMDLAGLSPHEVAGLAEAHRAARRGAAGAASNSGSAGSGSRGVVSDSRGSGWGAPAGGDGWLWARTGGNPFFVQALVEAGGSRLPGTVRDVVARRVARLPAGCRAQLERVAVVGRECELTLLGALGAADPVAVLYPAVVDGVVERVGGRVRFTHDLVREALLADLPTRQAIHLAVADVLAARADDPDVLPELARHALAALPLGDREAALGWARAAGELALRRLAYEEAARIFGRVLDEHVGDPSERLDLLLRTAEVLAWSHSVADAADRATQAVDLARRLGVPEAVGRAALVLPAVSDPEWIERSRAWTDEALAVLPTVDGPLRSRLLAQRALAASSGRDPSVVEAVSAAALAMAERLDDPPSLVAALRARQLARSGPEGNAERLELGTRLVGIGERTADPEDALWGRVWRFDALAQAGDLAAAEHEIELLEPLVARLRRPLARVHLLRCRAALAFGRGHFAEASALNEEAGELEAGPSGLSVSTSALRLVISGLTGDPCPEEEWIPEPARDDSTPNVAILRAELTHWYAERGRRAEAERVYRLLPPVGSPSIPRYIVLVVECRRAVAAADLGDRATGEAGLRWLRRHVDLFQAGGAGALTVSGSVHQYAGMAARAAGRTEAAVRHLRTAIALDDAAGLRPFAALGRARLAAILQRTGDRTEAGELAAAALRTARELGMRPLAARLEAAGDGPLSAREAEIAEWVGRGLTNRQIAATAHISERTVETHVQHILAKLGFSGRSQIAAWVAARHR
ncbi:ATP-binding protein [Pseudonocardia xishanensis]|uniref:AAA family ATPase n=1 Tax=Pseudonocardia xishanensis TaxID=630995 RepID=A0ABP8RIB4_9PSEU